MGEWVQLPVNSVNFSIAVRTDLTRDKTAAQSENAEEWAQRQVSSVNCSTARRVVPHLSSRAARARAARLALNLRLDLVRAAGSGEVLSKVAS